MGTGPSKAAVERRQLLRKTVYEKMKRQFRVLMLTDSEIRMFVNEFCKVDIDYSGTISFTEFTRFYEVEPSPFVMRAFGSLDVDGSHSIDAMEYGAAMWHFNTLPVLGLISYAFELYDLDSGGSLSLEEILQMIEEAYGAEKFKAKGFLDALKHDVMKMTKIKDPALLLDVQIGKREFSQMCRKHSRILAPVVGMQIKLKKRIGGERFWTRMSEDRELAIKKGDQLLKHDAWRELFGVLLAGDDDDIPKDEGGQTEVTEEGCSSKGDGDGKGGDEGEGESKYGKPKDPRDAMLSRQSSSRRKISTADLLIANAKKKDEERRKRTLKTRVKACLTCQCLAPIVSTCRGGGGGGDSSDDDDDEANKRILREARERRRRLLRGEDLRVAADSPDGGGSDGESVDSHIMRHHRREHADGEDVEATLDGVKSSLDLRLVGKERERAFDWHTGRKRKKKLKWDRVDQEHGGPAEAAAVKGKEYPSPVPMAPLTPEELEAFPIPRVKPRPKMQPLHPMPLGIVHTPHERVVGLLADSGSLKIEDPDRTIGEEEKFDAAMYGLNAGIGATTVAGSTRRTSVGTDWTDG